MTKRLLILALLGCSCAIPSVASSISVNQHPAACVDSGTTNSQTCSFASNTTVGNFIWVSAAAFPGNNSQNPSCQVSNAAGDSFSPAASNGQHTSGGGWVYIWGAQVATAGKGVTVSCTPASGSTMSITLDIFELTIGSAASWTFPDKGNGASGTSGTSLSVASFTPTNSNEIVLAAGTNDNNESFTAGTNFTLGSNITSGQSIGTEYWVQGSATATTAPLTQAGSDNWAEVASSASATTGSQTPNISSLSPTVGPPSPVGSSVTITGTNFGSTQSSSAVTFGGVVSTPTSWSATKIVAPVPGSLAAGSVNVVVTVGGVASNAQSFFVIPVITGLSPSSGAVGTSVTISGAGFGASQGSSTVTFNGVTATSTSWSASSIVVPVPNSATTGNVVVTVNGNASNGAQFTVGLPPPVINSVSPTSGPVGTSVTIAGTNFGSSQGSSTVSFNGTAATPTSWSSTSIAVPVPSGATTGNLVVTVGGNASNGVTFTTTLGIGSVSPTSGTAGTSVTISGTNFGSSQGSSTVTFNFATATVTSWSTTSIVATVPGNATTGNVVVTVSGNASNGVPFAVIPTVTSLSPTSGTVGTALTISGSNFGASQGSNLVTFGGLTATATSWSNTTIQTSVPSAAVGGVAQVAVTAGGNASNSLTFTVSPFISTLSPSSGVVGTSVTIQGNAFGANQGTSTITFNGTAAAPTSWSNTSIVVPVPSAATGGQVVVTVGGSASVDASVNGAPFTVNTQITSLSPSSGGTGTAITIIGSGFGGAQGSSTVTFNGTAATPTSWSPTQIVVPVPSGATSGNVVVTVVGNASNGASFTVTPGITSLSPTVGPVGTSVTITGTTFGATQGGSTVTFNGTAGTPTSWSSTSIVVPVPSGATAGNVVVTVAGNASNGVSFTVTPGITSLSPTLGPVKTSVTITGTTLGATQGSSTIAFNGAAATPSSWSNTQVVVPVPAAATTGNVVVTVAGNASNGVNFTVTPTITGLAPSSGAIGSSVAIDGGPFGATQGSSTVTFNGTAATINSWTNTRLIAVALSGTTTGNVVVTVAGHASNGATFTVVPPPNITSVSPTIGVAGTAVTITGTNFGAKQGAAGEITFGGVPCRCSPPWSNTSITATVPFGASTGNVVVTAPGGVTSNAVLFSVPPAIASLTPGVGSVGSSITISGSNFGSAQGTSTVTFNGTAATPTSWSAASIIVPVPNGASTGNVVVRVAGLASAGVNFAVAPTATSLSPTSGLPGASVTITGNNFGATQGTSTVTFNGVAASPTSWNSTQIVAPVPATATTGNVIVTVGGNPSVGLPFTLISSIAGLSPNSGPVGTSVKINGNNFGAVQGSSTISFNGTTAPPSTWSNTWIAVPVPAGTSTGNVWVTVGGVASNNMAFTVVPNISSISPAVAAIGTSVTITGSGGFGSSQGSSTVTFNGTTAASSSWSDTQIVVPVPSGATTGNVVVTVGGMASNSVPFAVAPAITSLSPTVGAVGTTVTISGTGFAATQGNSTVTFNGASANPSSWSNTQIVVPVPSGVTTGSVVVTVGANASNSVSFTVTQGQPEAGSALTSFVASDGSSHTFYVGPDQHVYTLFWNSAVGWEYQDLTILTGNNLAATTSSLTSFFKSDGSYHVAYRDGNSHVNQLVFSGGIWANQDVTAASGSSVAAASNSSLTSFTNAAGDHIYYLAANQHEYQLYFNGSSWSNQDLTASSSTSQPLPASASALTGFALSDASEHSFYVGTNQHVYQMLFVSGTGYFVQDLTETAALDLADGPCAPENGTCFGSSTHTVGFGVNGAYNFLAVTGNVACNVATFGDPAPGVTKACYLVNAAFPVAASGSALTSFNDSSGDHLYYLDSNGHNHLLFLAGDPGVVTSPWLDQDQTKDAGTTVAATAGSALSSFPTSDGTQHLGYLATNQHVDQMLDESGKWVNQDLTTMAGASATAAAGSGLTSFGPADGNSQNVQYLDTNGHINLLALNSSNNWQNQDLTAIAVNASPSISSLSGTSGTAGTPVTITGTMFGTSQGSSTVSFNGTVGVPTSWSTTSIVIPVPSGANTGNVVITVNGLSSNGVSFTVLPSISSITPPSASVGTVVAIAGTSFGATQGTSTVTFNGVAAAPASWSNTQIVVAVPSGAATGNVVVTVGGQASNGAAFGVAPGISSLSASSGLIGSQLTITGTAFGASQNGSTVTFNGAPATPSTWSNGSIAVTVPIGASTGNVVVTVAGLASNGAPFTVTSPFISNLSPPAGLAGSSLTINGANFGSTTGTVTFGGHQVTPTSWSTNAVGITVPSTATAGNNSVVVTVGSSSTNPANYLVTTAPPPTITSLSSSSGPVGASIVITGSNFGGSPSGNAVTFNGVAASITSWSSGSITAVVPTAATSGFVVVTVAGVPSGGVQFTVLPPPSITSLSPNSGGVGSSITINGSNFGGSQGTSTVAFNGVNATGPTLWSANQIIVSVPNGATTGNVVVTTAAGPSNPVNFTVMTITSVTLTQGPVGVGLVIRGTNFGPFVPGPVGQSLVTFNGTATFPIGNSWQDHGAAGSTVTVRVPAGATTGPIRLTNSSGGVVTGPTFTVTGPLSNCP